jgi:hypothetical protein
MNSASRQIAPGEEPLAPRSLGTLAAALVTCTHPEESRVRATADCRPGETAICWCAACGALWTEDVDVQWQAPSLTSALSRKAFDELALLLHAVVQLAQLARAHTPAGPAGSPAHVCLRTVSRSLSELSRLPVVRDVDRLEQLLAEIPKSPLAPSR